MIFKKHSRFISICFLISSLKLTCCSDIELDGKLSSNKPFHQKYNFDRFRLNFVNLFNARLESNENERTPIEERALFRVFNSLLHIRREMENEMYKNAWYLRRGR